MNLSGPVLSLVLLMLLGTPAIRASDVRKQEEGNISTIVPYAAMLPNCPQSCGNLSFSYPFGIGHGCFRQTDFSLICDNTTQPPKLFFHDNTTEIIESIDVIGQGGDYYVFDDISIAFSQTVPVTSGVDVYGMSWEPPGRSFSLAYTTLNFTCCNFDVYLVDNVTNTNRRLCTAACPNEEITETEARQSCNGTGCCSVDFLEDVSSIQLSFQRHNNSDPKTSSTHRSSLWKKIDVRTDKADLQWSIVEQTRCMSALDDKKNYACVSNHSQCIDSYFTPNLGYLCKCKSGYVGNPYILNGCSRDEGYHPVQRKGKCSRSCGNISVPFPFGLEEGCSGRKLFQLNCTDIANSTLKFDDTLLVMNISISDGTVDVKYTSYDQEDQIFMTIIGEPKLYVGYYGESVSVQWAVANLTCEEANRNSSTYACVSSNTSCIPLSSPHGYIGYQCKCPPGFDGNPYIADGCKDIDECKTPELCKGICQNTIGSYNCTKCPEKTEYDVATMQCSSRKKQNLLLGIIIGLISGFGILLLILSGTLIIRRWKRDTQKKLRKKYFRKNQGLLLEQLISTDESGSDNTKIFSLEELEKATNNFDTTRVLGRGGHGMVYKGILSDQRVVAIKKSKVIEQGEIDEFINEVAILSQINHRNIVKLFGCCLETEVPLLVYDFVSNGSLFEILHANSHSGICLSWDECLKIAAEAAGALYYLHSAASVSIFHRDVKSSNILLDANYTAKVSDFGASRLVPIDQTHIVTNVQGTYGYLDPEYYQTGQLNEKSDVYSFGVVLLELLLRKEPIFTGTSGTKQNLSNFFLWELKSRPPTEIVSAQVLEEASKEEIDNIASLAEMCLSLRGEERPTMKHVEMILQFLRAKRSSSCHVDPGNDEEILPLLSTREKASCQSATLNLDDRVNLASQHSQTCYSFEQEFTSSAS